MTKILFFGSSDFSLLALEALCDSGFTPVAIVTQPDRPRGRGQKVTPLPVKVFAAENKIPLYQFETTTTENLSKLFKDTKASLAIVASYGQLIPGKVLGMLPWGFLNIHPSLLPKFRGPTPIQTALLKGEDQTGVTIMKLDEKMDHGAILAQESIKITRDDDFASLHDKLSVAGAQLLIKFLPVYLSGKIVPCEQNHKEATFTKFLNKNDARINWTCGADEIHRLVRALSPSPAAWTTFQNKRVQILKATPVSGDKREKTLPGQSLFMNGQFFVDCGRGSLRIDLLKLESRSAITGLEFGSGHSGKSMTFS